MRAHFQCLVCCLIRDRQVKKAKETTTTATTAKSQMQAHEVARVVSHHKTKTHIHTGNECRELMPKEKNKVHHSLERSASARSVLFVSTVLLATFWLFQCYTHEKCVYSIVRPAEYYQKAHILSRHTIDVCLCMCVCEYAREYTKSTQTHTEWDKRQRQRQRLQQQRQQHRYRLLSSKRAYIWFFVFGYENNHYSVRIQLNECCACEWSLGFCSTRL